jgi:hypothetical protein
MKAEEEAKRVIVPKIMPLEGTRQRDFLPEIISLKFFRLALLPLSVSPHEEHNDADVINETETRLARSS